MIDQFRGDYLERYRDQIGDAGFKLFLDHGAYFDNCNYNYANTRTAPGHATLLTGAYTKAARAAHSSTRTRARPPAQRAVQPRSSRS